ncbi:invasion associated locus B family protein [Phyllobacterium salinisoli]|uniref:Invasion associated locus B family protein n=1 Tax=Phyllobacterium salinisoli TaxID=1899321 RepID=A0A368JWS6_9HYPH|nr:invasion associated locus B family protein [Phyllobacterium salinisoli]RCS21618.1 invasion associated locus B family protein [Phyllobacterium salinisoli]
MGKWRGPAYLEGFRFSRASAAFINSGYRIATGGLVLLAGASIFLADCAHAGGQDMETYRLKPSEVVVPQDIPLGSYRRIIRPFENWDLICDENLQAKRRVCNVSQSFIDQKRELVFSWSLAADEKGKPFMILRAPSQPGAKSMISLAFAGRKKTVDVELSTCDSTICLSYLPVGPILRQQIENEANVGISYSGPSGTNVSLDAPLKGLKTALSAIN